MCVSPGHVGIEVGALTCLLHSGTQTDRDATIWSVTEAKGGKYGAQGTKAGPVTRLPFNDLAML